VWHGARHPRQRAWGVLRGVLGDGGRRGAPFLLQVGRIGQRPVPVLFCRRGSFVDPFVVSPLFRPSTQFRYSRRRFLAVGNVRGPRIARLCRRRWMFRCGGFGFWGLPLWTAQLHLGRARSFLLFLVFAGGSPDSCRAHPLLCSARPVTFKRGRMLERTFCTPLFGDPPPSGAGQSLLLDFSGHRVRAPQGDRYRPSCIPPAVFLHLSLLLFSHLTL